MKGMATPVFLPGESHGQRSLVGYSPWGHKESDLTERLTLSGDGGDSFTNTRKSIGTQPCSGPYAEGRKSPAHQLLCRILKQTHSSLSPKSLA